MAGQEQVEDRRGGSDRIRAVSEGAEQFFCRFINHDPVEDDRRIRSGAAHG